MYKNYDEACHAAQVVINQSKYGSCEDFSIEPIVVGGEYAFNVSIYGCVVLSFIEELNVDFVDASIDEFRSFLSFLSKQRKINLINVESSGDENRSKYTIEFTDSRLKNVITFKVESSYKLNKSIDVLTDLNYDIIGERLYA